jgi:hypothetical protein
MNLYATKHSRRSALCMADRPAVPAHDGRPG